MVRGGFCQAASQRRCSCSDEDSLCSPCSHNKVVITPQYRACSHLNYSLNDIAVYAHTKNLHRRCKVRCDHKRWGSVCSLSWHFHTLVFIWKLKYWGLNTPASHSGWNVAILDRAENTCLDMLFDRIYVSLHGADPVRQEVTHIFFHTLRSKHLLKHSWWYTAYAALWGTAKNTSVS